MLEELWAWTRAESACRPTHRPLSPDDVARLEDVLRRPVVGFAYPYGFRSDYTEETVDIVRESGFAWACSNFGDAVWGDADRFQLPRMLVRNWNGEECARNLKGWFRV